MKKEIKSVIKSLLPAFIQKIIRDSGNKRAILKWEKNGYPNPTPHIIKQNAISEYQKKYGCKILIETGTYLGDMVEVQKKRFDKIISIELGSDLYAKAKERFKNDKNIVIIQGDSARVLPEVILSINEPAIFWLDGHYSGGITAKGEIECPIMGELDAIFSGKIKDHILLIDDAREFKGINGYPTIEKLSGYVKSKNEKYQIEVKHDIIRCVVGN